MSYGNRAQQPDTAGVKPADPTIFRGNMLLILQSEPISESERMEFATRLLAAWTRAPGARLGQLLLLACAERQPASPAGLLTTIEDRALVELVEAFVAKAQP